jgi:hypothetical protein
MLKGGLGQMLGMAWQVDLTVAADNPAVAFDQDRGVVVPRFALLLG